MENIYFENDVSLFLFQDIERNVERYLHRFQNSDKIR